MKFKLRVFFSILISIFCMYVIFFQSARCIALNHKLYNYEQEKLNISETVGMEESAVEESMDVLLDYVEDNTDTITIQAEVNGLTRDVFSKDERLHMLDVKRLYHKLNVVDIACITFIIVLLLILYMDNYQSLSYVLSYAYARIYPIVVFILCALCVYAYVDFYNFWYGFHTIFFTGNTLWLMDPTTSIMINMLPEHIFYVIVFSIVGIFLFITTILFILSIHIQRRELKKLREQNA